MFEIKVSNLQDSFYERAKWATKAVGLIDPERNSIGDKNYHIELFHDIPWPNSEMMVSPNPDHLKRIMKFTKNFTDEDKILVHCHQGVSRSTAIAIAILIQHGMTSKEAINKIHEVRDCMWPNDLIIQYTDKYFKLNNELVDEVAAFKKKWNNKFIVPSSEPSQDDIDHMQRLKDILNGRL